MIPIFTSHYSVGRSILTLSDEEKEKGPRSIIEICKRNQIKDLYLVDTRMSGYLEGYENSQKNDLNFRFGLEIKVCNDCEKKEKKGIHKFIIFILNYQGYKDLLKINNESFSKYEGFTDLAKIREYWTENLSLVVPFYGSYIHKNLTTFDAISFDISDLNPFYLWEEHGLPFDKLIQSKIQKERDNTIESHRIYYEKISDFKSYLTYRCIHNRKGIENPNIDYFASKDFSIESWKLRNVKI